MDAKSGDSSDRPASTCWPPINSSLPAPIPNHMCQKEDRSSWASRASWERVGRYMEGWLTTFPTKLVAADTVRYEHDC